jgi:hypothetical protein
MASYATATTLLFTTAAGNHPPIIGLHLCCQQHYGRVVLSIGGKLGVGIHARYFSFHERSQKLDRSAVSGFMWSWSTRSCRKEYGRNDLLYRSFT